MFSIWFPISFRWVTMFGYICINNTLLEAIIRFNHSYMGLTFSPNAMGDNDFELNMSPLVGFPPYSMWSTLDNNFHHFWRHQTWLRNWQ